MGVSIYAALISSITFIAYPGSAYAGNWNELVPGFMVVGVLILVGLVIIPFFRHAVGMSAYEYFERRFGYKVRAYSALAFAAGHFSKMRESWVDRDPCGWAEASKDGDVL